MEPLCSSILGFPLFIPHVYGSLWCLKHWSVRQIKPAQLAFGRTLIWLLTYLLIYVYTLRLRTTKVGVLTDCNRPNTKLSAGRQDSKLRHCNEEILTCDKQPLALRPTVTNLPRKPKATAYLFSEALCLCMRKVLVNSRPQVHFRCVHYT